MYITLSPIQNTLQLLSKDMPSIVTPAIMPGVVWLASLSNENSQWFSDNSSQTPAHEVLSVAIHHSAATLVKGKIDKLKFII
jgi:hypothetical protein